MAWTADDIADQSGRIAIVTGANGGLGLETARELARAGAHVVIAARNLDKAAAAEADIMDGIPWASLEVVGIDLASQISIGAAADHIAESHDHVDLLVNNAGVMAITEQKTDDGFEMQFGVNHLGHWALTARLLPMVLAAPAPRVVTVTSTAHHMGRSIDPETPQLEGNRYGPWKAYGQSKLANFHFGLGLQRRFESAGVAAASLIAHPGLTHSDLQATSVEGSGGGLTQKGALWMTRATGMSVAAGALPQLRAATDPYAKGGEFYGPRFFNFGPPVRLPVLRRLGLERAIERLWAVSERETGLAIEIPS